MDEDFNNKKIHNIMRTIYSKLLQYYLELWYIKNFRPNKIKNLYGLRKNVVGIEHIENNIGHMPEYCLYITE